MGRLLSILGWRGWIADIGGSAEDEGSWGLRSRVSRQEGGHADLVFSVRRNPVVEQEVNCHTFYR